MKFILDVVLDARLCQVWLRKLESGGDFSSFRTHVAHTGIMYAHGGKHDRRRRYVIEFAHGEWLVV